MNYAIIKLQGHQYKVSEGETIVVDKIEGAPAAEILLLVNGDDVKIGDPIVKDAKISFKVLGDEKGDKLYIRKYKAKSRYRRKTGFRSSLTRLQVEKIA